MGSKSISYLYELSHADIQILATFNELDYYDRNNADYNEQSEFNG